MNTSVLCGQNRLESYFVKQNLINKICEYFSQLGVISFNSKGCCHLRQPRYQSNQYNKEHHIKNLDAFHPTPLITENRFFFFI